ncbi:transmembrane protein 216-like [Coccinella septempunctata]|uniref:transmembrane protein 216-like n=1 Tax=Coccinella septempunctata TaxID=41139 RepID=UPI001D06078E|nr:transmembrane protein 216-like [Coccinella septempunctata]
MIIPLIFEVLLYLNSYYFGFFALCEISMFSLKYLNGNNESEKYQTDFSILAFICIIEIFRVTLARRGNLTEKRWTVFIALMLTIPSGAGLMFLIFLQTKILRLEYTICLIQFVFEILEIATGILLLLPSNKSSQYY